MRIRILITTQKDAVTIPPVAVQRGPEGLYVWVIKPDNTAEKRTVTTQTVSDSIAIATKGLAAGERVVVNGQYRLDTGNRVDAKTETAANGPEKAS